MRPNSKAAEVDDSALKTTPAPTTEQQLSAGLDAIYGPSGKSDIRSVPKDTEHPEEREDEPIAEPMTLDKLPISKMSFDQEMTVKTATKRASETYNTQGEKFKEKGGDRLSPAAEEQLNTLMSDMYKGDWNKLIDDAFPKGTNPDAIAANKVFGSMLKDIKDANGLGIGLQATEGPAEVNNGEVPATGRALAITSTKSGELLQNGNALVVGKLYTGGAAGWTQAFLSDAKEVPSAPLKGNYYNRSTSENPMILNLPGDRKMDEQSAGLLNWALLRRFRDGVENVAYPTFSR